MYAESVFTIYSSAHQTQTLTHTPVVAFIQFSESLDIPEMAKCNLIKVLVKWFMLTLGLNAMCQSVKSSIHFVSFWGR